MKYYNNTNSLIFDCSYKYFILIILYNNKFYYLLYKIYNYFISYKKENINNLIKINKIN